MQIKRVFIFILLFCFNQLIAQDLEKVKELKNITKKKPFEFHGSLGLGAMSYFSNSNTKRNSPFTWFATGTPIVSIYGFKMPFTLAYSETGRSLTHPFVYNFYGVSPYYKWVKTHFGFRSIQFSEYTQGGMLFNGAGLEINPGLLRLGAFYGVINPGVEEDTSKGAYGVVLPAYKRIAYGAKIGIGKENWYFDLIGFKGKDLPNSIKLISENNKIKPSENIAIGIKSRVPIKKWYLEIDGAISALTKNILNDTLKETDDLKTVYQFMRVNTTTSAYYAGHAMLGCNYNKWGVNFKIKEVSSDYSSMGIYYIQNDLREYTVSPNVRLFKNKVSLNGSYGFYTDNVSKKRASTTVRKIINTGLNFTPNDKLNLGLTYSNFGTSRANGLIQLNDSITFSLISENYGLNASYNLKGKKNTKNLNYFLNFQQAEDRNIFSGDFNHSQTLSTALSYGYNISKSKLNFSTNLSYTQFNANGQFIQNLGPGFNLSKPFFKNKIRMALNFLYSTRFKNNSKQGNIFNTGLTGSYQINKHHSLNIMLNMLQNTTGIVSNQLLSEQRLSAKYLFNF